MRFSHKTLFACYNPCVMPELPEVETTRRGLEKYLVGKEIVDIDVRLAKIVSGDTGKIIGATIQSVRRFGKALVIDLSNDFSIAIHIKMTGQLIYKGPDVPKGTTVSEKAGGELPNKHTHVVFKLKAQIANRKSEKEDSVLYYNDIRQFGWIKIVQSARLKDESFFSHLGPEPFKDLNLSMFGQIIKSKKGPVKPLLMDQKLIAGIGNIYANDALFLAKINPKRKANTLSDKEIEKLFGAIETVLKKGLEVGGASEWQYVNALGETGNYQNFFKVYGKAGERCPVCETKIEKIVMGGRGTFYCPKCQK